MLQQAIEVIWLVSITTFRGSKSICYYKDLNGSFEIL